jgi:HEPN domain-containing protein
MNETVREWVAKAEADFATAKRELAAKDSPNYDAVCFHAQKCVEKLMKASLILRGITAPKTHDLVQLDHLIRSEWSNWTWPLEDLRFLTRAAVALRYPGESAELDVAEEAVKTAGQLRERLLLLLGTAR